VFTRAGSGTLIVLLAATIGCRRPTPSPEEQAPDETVAPAPSLEPPAAASASARPPDSPCPPEMAWIPSGFCIDRWESIVLEEDGRIHSPFHPVSGKVKADSRAGAVPQAHISAEQGAAACERSGKVLCSTKQWVDACMGVKKPGRVWPYGGDHRKGACNDSTSKHPVDRLMPGMGRKRDAITLNDPRINQQSGTLAPAGSHPQCVTPEGAYDLVGNLLEWTTGQRPLLMGGHYVDATENGKGCTYVTMMHDEKYADYTTGFRCCKVPPKTAPAAPSSSAAVSPPRSGRYRSFDDPSAPLPPGPGPASYPSPDAACPDGMALVDGERCTLVRQDCLRWADPPGGVPQRTCAEFASPTVCEGPRRKMRYCIDRLEYTPPGFELPLVHVSMTEAENLCNAQGKRLCDELEWEFACEGPDALPYPYGHVRDGSRCNHDVSGELFPGGKLADRRVGSSSLERCVSPFGVQSLVGNVDEWCVRPGASPRSVLRGGWWLTGRNRCRAVTDSHGENYAGPQTSFRCCKAAR